MDSRAGDRHLCDASVSSAFTILGKRWNGMIIDALSVGPCSFVVLRRSVTGISDAVLSDRLAELTDVGLIARDVAPGPPVSVSYSLTRAGEELVPVLKDLGRWAQKNLSADARRGS